MRIEGANALVVGMARSGLAAAELLAAHGASVTTTDAKPIEQLEGVAETLARLGISFAPHSADICTGRDLIVISPGVPADLPMLEQARAAGVEVIGELELAAYFLQGETIGITGSNGKTTTTALAGHILRACGIPCQVGGNIGTPPASMVASSRPGQWNVLELSSFQLETTRTFRATIGVALNVTPNHLNRHHTLENYEAAKGRLFATQRPGDFAVLNADNPACVRYAELTRSEVRWFSLRGPVDRGACFDGEWIRLDGEPVLRASDLRIRGLHNVENAMAAIIACRLAGAEIAQIAEAARSFEAVEHRLEFVKSLRGVAFYNDSKATSVDATLKALAVFDGRLWVILGGEDKGSDYRVLREELAAKARGVLLIGSAAGKIAQHLDGAVALSHCGTLDAAVRYAFTRAERGDTILLAPACASFDQFRSFEHRGSVFKEIVRQLESEG